MSKQSRKAVGLGVTALVLGVGLVCLINGARRIGHPFSGFLLAKNRIIVSIGRPAWSLDRVERILFAQVIGVNGHAVDDAGAVRAYVEAQPVDALVTYRLRKGTDVFVEKIEVRRFGFGDFGTVYVTFFVVGLCFALSGLYAFWPRATPAPVSAFAFFVFCQVAALVLLTGGDVYGPYWFTDLYFTAHCLTPAALFHFASAYPEPIGDSRRWRRLAIALPYAGALALAVTIPAVMSDASVFLPLVYTVWLLTANAALLYLARLALGLWGARDEALRASLRRALFAILSSSLLASVIFVIYPALKQAVPPVLLVAPLAILPLGTASALRRAGTAVQVKRAASVRLRLSLLFLGAVETAFLISVAIFWLANSQQGLFDDVILNQRQQARVEKFLGGTHEEAGASLDAIDALAQTVGERALSQAARRAVDEHDWAQAQAEVERLGARYRTVAAHLAAYRRWIGRLAMTLVLVLVIVGVVQAVTFMLAVQRWLIAPIGRLAAATEVIATGDLSHRLQPDATEEFAALGHAINAMATSLGEIQQRIRAAQEARHQAAAEAREAERRRVARELHEGVLQDLTAVKLRLESELKHNPALPLWPITEELISVITDIRRVVDDLRPAGFAAESLNAAIAEHARAVVEASGIALQVDLPSSLVVPEWAARDTYRIAQEAIANAVRHSQAKKLTIRLFRQDGKLTLEIADDGIGYDPERVPLGGGLVGMRERAAAVGAEFELVSSPGMGTRVRVAFPPHLSVEPRPPGPGGAKSPHPG